VGTGAHLVDLSSIDLNSNIKIDEIMKHIYRMLLSVSYLLLLLLGITSCQDEVMEGTSSSEIRMIRVSVDVSSAQSRVNHSDAADGSIDVKWEIGDVIYAGIPQANSSLAEEIHFNEMIGNVTYTPDKLGFYPLVAQSVSEDGKTASFTGVVPESFGGQSVTMVYGCDDVLVYHNSGCLLLEAKSRVMDYENPLSDLKGYDAMSATVDNFSIESVNKVHFRHEFALLKLTLDLSAVTDGKKLKSLEITNDSGTVFANRKVAGEGTAPTAVTASSSSYNVVLSPKNTYTTSQDVYMFMSLDDAKYQGNSIFNLVLKTYDCSVFTGSFNGGASVFEDGKLYKGPNVKLSFKEMNYDGLKLPGKKGVAAKTMMSKVVALNGFWNYTWKKDYYDDQPLYVKFLPMTWGRFTPNQTIPYLQNIINQGKVDRVLAFNEPDTKDQSNMTVDEALKLWPYLESLGVPLGSPAMATSPTGKWFEEFMTRAEELGYRIDFICVHDYVSSCSVANLEKKLLNTYNKYKRPILLTEFAIADRTAETIEDNRYTAERVLNYMKSALDYLEGAEYVLGYAWFSFGANDPEGWPSALFDSQNNLTELGKYYSNFKADELERPEPVPTEFYVEYKSTVKAEFPLYYNEYDETSQTGKVYFNTSTVPGSLFKGNTNITKVVISPKITIIGSNAFNGCTSLNEIVFAENGQLNEIQNYAFMGCSGFTGTLRIPKSVTNMAMGAFKNMSNMTGLEIGTESKLYNVGYDCFNGCISIENKVVLPATITKIGGLAFGGKMKSGNFELELHATVPPTNKPDNICDGTTLKAIYVPAGSVEAYKESTIGQYGDKIMAIGLE